MRAHLPLLVDAILSSSIERIDFRKHPQLGPDLGLVLGRALIFPECRLTDLFLFNTSLGDVGASYLANALKSNATMTKLNLCDNGITALGAKHLSEMLLQNKTLKVLEYALFPFACVSSTA